MMMMMIEFSLAERGVFQHQGRPVSLLHHPWGPARLITPPCGMWYTGPKVRHTLGSICSLLIIFSQHLITTLCLDRLRWIIRNYLRDEKSHLLTLYKVSVQIIIFIVNPSDKIQVFCNVLLLSCQEGLWPLRPHVLFCFYWVIQQINLGVLLSPGWKCCIRHPSLTPSKCWFMGQCWLPSPLPYPVCCRCTGVCCSLMTWESVCVLGIRFLGSLTWIIVKLTLKWCVNV